MLTVGRLNGWPRPIFSEMGGGAAGVSLWPVSSRRIGNYLYMDTRNDSVIYILLAALASAYALLLSTDQGRRFTDEHTAETVILGVGLVLGTLRLILPEAFWWRVAIAFGVAGTPLVARSLLKRPGGLILKVSAGEK